MPRKHPPPPIDVGPGTRSSNADESPQEPLTPLESYLLEAFPSPKSPGSVRPRPQRATYTRNGGSGRAPRPPILYHKSKLRRVPPGNPGALPLSPPPYAIPEASSDSGSESPRGRLYHQHKDDRRRSRTQSSNALSASDREGSTASESESEPPRGRHRHQHEDGRMPRPRSKSSDTLSLWDRKRSRGRAPENERSQGRGRDREEETHHASPPDRAETPEEFRMHPGTPVGGDEVIWAPEYPYNSHLHYADIRSRQGAVSNRDQEQAPSPSDSDDESLTALPPMPRHDHEAMTPLEKARGKVQKNPSRYRAATSHSKRRRWWIIGGSIAVCLSLVFQSSNLDTALTRMSILTACCCHHCGRHRDSHGSKR